MKSQISTSEETVGLFLANGFTKKETAVRLQKSERTVGRQADELYKKTGSRNLADITRFMVKRYRGVDGLVNALSDITAICFFGFMVWTFLNNTDTNFLDEVKASVNSLFMR